MLLVFVPSSVLYLREKLTLDYLWAGLCLLALGRALPARRGVFHVPRQPGW